MVEPLPCTALRWRCDPDSLPFETTAEVEPVGGVIGQPSAVESLRFGLECAAPGPNVLALTDARMGEIYSAAFDVRSGSVRVLHEPECLPPDQFALPGGEGWYLIGSALRAYPDLVSRATGKISGTNADAVPLAADIAALAATTIAHTGAIAPELGQPIYVRDKVALTTAERLARGGKA